MAIAYTESEFQARFPEALNRAQEGETVVIAREGEPVAELRPIKRDEDGEENETMEERLERMRRMNPARSKESWSSFKPVAHVPGGLQRFLDERAYAYRHLQEEGETPECQSHTPNRKPKPDSPKP